MKITGGVPRQRIGYRERRCEDARCSPYSNKPCSSDPFGPSRVQSMLCVHRGVSEGVSKGVLKKDVSVACMVGPLPCLHGTLVVKACNYVPSLMSICAAGVEKCAAGVEKCAAGVDKCAAGLAWGVDKNPTQPAMSRPKSANKPVR
jgi:hypothetical protein